MEYKMNKFLILLSGVLIFILFSLPAWAVDVEPVVAQHGMVVTEQKLASEVGARILKAGGNAIDAAVAVGYALAVVNPCCGNIGGGGFMLIHLANGKNIFLNFREKAPLAGNSKMFLDDRGNIIPEKSTYGYSAVAVPGTVLGLETALKKYGTMTRQQVMAPAIELASKGFILGPGDIALLQFGTKNFKRQANVAAIFLKNGQPYQVGDRLVQKDLATTLSDISKQGAKAFYRGRIAKIIVEASNKNGGYLSVKDFENYRVEEEIPITCTYHGYKIISAPPPSSGGVALCESLNILESYPLQEWGFHSVQGSHYIIEAMRFAFADRNNNMGDPDFVNNPVTHLISKDYAAQIRRVIPDNKAIPSTSLPMNFQPQHEGNNTTHYSVIDQDGNAVAVTFTINRFFGAYVIADHTGFFLNDEMDDFTAKPGVANQFGLVQSAKNNIQPGKRPLSSMTPTIVMKDRQPLIVLGSPGGPRIITTVLQTILNILEYNLNVQAAVDAPRFHQQWLPDVVDIEQGPDVFSADVMEKLERMGYHFKQRPVWSAVEAIYIDPRTKMLYGGSDSRKAAGGAVGY